MLQFRDLQIEIQMSSWKQLVLRKQKLNGEGARKRRKTEQFIVRQSTYPTASPSIPTPRGIKAKPPRHRRRAPTRRRFGGHLRGRVRSSGLGRDKLPDREGWIAPARVVDGAWGGVARHRVQGAYTAPLARRSPLTAPTRRRFG